MDFNYWIIILILMGVTTILSVCYFVRELNGEFDAGEFNESDMNYCEDCEKYGCSIASIIEAFVPEKDFLKNNSIKRLMVLV